MKTVLINKLTARALDSSIKKWVKVAVPDGACGMGGNDCALCMRFNRSFNWQNRTVQMYGDEQCEQCPIALATGEINCGGTPFDRYCDDRAQGNEDDELRSAEAMLQFLRDLKDKCEVIPGLRRNEVKA